MKPDLWRNSRGLTLAELCTTVSLVFTLGLVLWIGMNDIGKGFYDDAPADIELVESRISGNCLQRTRANDLVLAPQARPYDCFRLEDGNDKLYLDRGTNLVHPGPGRDTVIVRPGAGDTQIVFGGGNDIYAFGGGFRHRRPASRGAGGCLPLGFPAIPRHRSGGGFLRSRRPSRLRSADLDSNPGPSPSRGTSRTSRFASSSSRMRGSMRRPCPAPPYRSSRARAATGSTPRPSPTPCLRARATIASSFWKATTSSPTRPAMTSTMRAQVGTSSTSAA